MYTILSQKNFPFEDTDFPKTGIQYTLSMYNYIFPILFTITILFMLSNLYGSFYYDRINLNSLLPEAKKINVLKNILSGILVTVGLFLFFNFFAFAIASLFFGTGNLDYPVVHYSLDTQKLYFDAVKTSILPTIMLQVLSLIFVVSFVFFISSLFKDKLITLLLSTLIIIGGFLLINTIQPLQEVAEYIPMTYLKSYEISTGVLQETIQNYTVSTNLGIVVLFISIFFLVMIPLFLEDIKNILRAKPSR